MAGGYKRYDVTEMRVTEAPPIAAAKRRRDCPSDLNLSRFNTPEDGRRETYVVVDTDPIGASYDLYLQCENMSPFTGEESSQYVDGRLDEHPIDISVREYNPLRYNESPSMALGGGRPKTPVQSDASRTLFVKGLPLDCTRREVSHLFRPFIGYEEARLVRKAPRHPGGDPTVFCFVDFVSPAHAAGVKDALQGYAFDELDPHSGYLRLEFARYPAARSGGGHC